MICLSLSWAAFVSNWVPNIVCGLLGCLISFWLGYRYALVTERALTNVLEGIPPSNGA